MGFDRKTANGRLLLPELTSRDKAKSFNATANLNRLTETAKANRIEPHRYLGKVFTMKRECEKREDTHHFQ